MVDYQKIAKEARIKVLEMIYKAQSSHIGSNFSCIDILSVLFEKMDLKRDKFIASKGWIAASVYYFLACKGVIPIEDLKRYCMPEETKYIGLIEPQGKFGLEAAGGAVGYGLPFAVGFALAKKLKKEKGKVYVLLSDGEMDTGTLYEAALIAAHYRLDNLVAIVDYNGFQATGKTNEVLQVAPLGDKWQAFGWNVWSLPGHNFEHLDFILDCKSIKKPGVVIADTIKGKGVSFMENKLEWHYRNVDDESYQKAITELCT